MKRAVRVPGPKAPRVVFFDFGGTLAEPLVDLTPLVRRAADATGVRIFEEAYLRESDLAWRELWPDSPSYLGRRPSFAEAVHARALRRAGAVGPVAAMVEHLRHEIQAAEHHAPYAETEVVLATLRRRGYRLGIVSNHTDDLPAILRNLGWSPLFETVTFSQEIAAEKPDRRLFDLAVRRAGCAPGDALHVGDRREADFEGARGAGLRALWLNRERAPAPGRASVDQIHDLRELLDRLPGAARPSPPRPAQAGPRREGPETASTLPARRRRSSTR